MIPFAGLAPGEKALEICGLWITNGTITIRAMMNAIIAALVMDADFGPVWFGLFGLDDNSCNFHSHFLCFGEVRECVETI